MIENIQVKNAIKYEVVKSATVIGTAKNFSNFSLKCKVTDSNNQTAEDIYSERSLRK